MPTLRINQTAKSTGEYRVEIALTGDGLVPQTATASFAFEMTAQDDEDLRWYLEDYLQFPHEPAPTIAARIERRIADLGNELFKKVFESDEQSRRLWARVYEQLSDVRVEVVSSVREATAIPWELIRDPHTGTVLAHRAGAFVRTHDQPVETPQAVEAQSGPIRILLVICRPGQADDVPFRSVASRLVKALTDDTRALYFRPVFPLPGTAGGVSGARCPRLRQSDGRVGELLPNPIRWWQPRSDRRDLGRGSQPAQCPSPCAHTPVVEGDHRDDAGLRRSLWSHGAQGGVA